MLPKSLNLLLGLTIALNAGASNSATTSPFEIDSLGMCFESADSFMQKTLGGLDDPNIAKTSKGAWIWIMDRTASKNYAWYLLERNNAQTCLRAFLPAASDVRFQGKSFMQLDAFIAPEIGFPAKLIQLRAQSKFGSFMPFRCFLLKNRRHLVVRKKIPCEHIYD